LLSVLNSKLIYFYFSKIATDLGTGAFRWIKQFVEKIPVPKIPTSQQKPFEILVDSIIAKKARGEDSTAEEKQIDLMVYKLYGLTYEEVKIVDPQFEMSRTDYETTNSTNLHE